MFMTCVGQHSHENFALPAWNIICTQLSEKILHSEEGRMDRRHILVIEGERDLGEVIYYWLKKAGFDVTVAADSASGLEALYKNKPNLILVNEHLDQLSRYEFIREVRQSPDFRNTPILATIKGRCPTGNVVEAGADAVLRLPEDLQNLTPLVEMLLDSTPRQAILQGRQRPSQLPLNKY